MQILDDDDLLHKWPEGGQTMQQQVSEQCSAVLTIGIGMREWAE